jgi:uncharacterized protein YaaR (DUF327 family)
MTKVIKPKKWQNDAAFEKLQKKKRLLKKRVDTAQGLVDVPGFENLDLSKMPDFVSLVKHNRWQLHAKAASLNLFVTQKRSHQSTPNNLQEFTGQSDTYLAISRAALKIYSTGNPITATACADIVKALNIHKSSVYRYLREAVEAGVLVEVKNDGNVAAYEYTEQAEEEQFDNLLELIFDPSTFEYVQAMHRIYGSARMYLNQSYRRNKSATEYLLSLVDDDEEEPKE